MRMPNLPAVPPRAMTIAACSLAVVGLILAAWVWPNLRQEKVRKAMIAEAKARIEAQQILMPLQASLLKRLGDRPPLPGETLLQDGLKVQAVPLGQANQRLTALAEENGLLDPAFTPAPDSLSKDNKRLLVNGKVKGDLRNFRGFLLALTTTGFFDGLEMVEIRRPAAALEFSIRVWVLIS